MNNCGDAVVHVEMKQQPQLVSWSTAKRRVVAVSTVLVILLSVVLILQQVWDQESRRVTNYWLSTNVRPRNADMNGL